MRILIFLALVLALVATLTLPRLLAAPASGTPVAVESGTSSGEAQTSRVTLPRGGER